jgi:hypothetical protein
MNHTVHPSGGIFDLYPSPIKGEGIRFSLPCLSAYGGTVRPFDMLMVLSPSSSFRINEVEAQTHHKWEGIKGRVR